VYDNKERRNYHYGQDVQIYCIGVGDLGSGNSENMEYSEPSSLEILEGLARVTGSRAFFPWKDEEMVDAAASIALELRRQYSIGYYPTDLKQDGKWHKIKVRVNSLPGRTPESALEGRLLRQSVK
jgi:Ca-activated chloride channel family protein